MCDVLFLALKQRHRLLQVFRNMSVNNGQGSIYLYIDLSIYRSTDIQHYFMNIKTNGKSNGVISSKIRTNVAID